MTMKRITATLDYLIFFMLLLNPLFSLFFEGRGYVYHYITLPILGFFLFIKLLKMEKVNKLAVLIVLCTVLSLIFAISFGGDYGKINNHLFNFLDASLMFVYCTTDDFALKAKNIFVKFLPFVKFIVILTNFIEFYMLVFNKTGFVYNWNWGGTFYLGTNSMPHTLAYLMLTVIILDILIVLLTKNKLYLVFSLLPFLCIFLSGVRIILAISVILFLIIFDITCSERDSVFIKLVKLIGFVLLVICLFYNQIINSDMMAKILLKMQNGDISSGRFNLWIFLLSYFINQSPVNWITGLGDQNVYFINSLNPKYRNNIWAHNDFIQILIGKGIPCFILYVYSMGLYFKNLFKYGRYYPFLASLLIFGLAFFNGFYTYRDFIVIPALLVIVFEISISSKSYSSNNTNFLSKNIKKYWKNLKNNDK